MNNFLLRNETWGVSNSARVYLAKNTGSVYSSKDNILQLLGLLFVFILVLFAAWYVSKLIGNKAMGGFGNRNINVIESFRLDNNKAIQIVRIADKYLAISVSKDNVNVLAQLNEEDIIVPSKDENNMNFKDILKNAKGILKKNTEKQE